MNYELPPNHIAPPCLWFDVRDNNEVDTIYGVAQELTYQSLRPPELAEQEHVLEVIPRMIDGGDECDFYEQVYQWYIEAPMRYGFVAARGIELGLVQLAIESCSQFASVCRPCPLVRAEIVSGSSGRTYKRGSLEKRYNELRDLAFAFSITVDEFTFIAARSKETAFDMAKESLETKNPITLAPCTPCIQKTVVR